MAPVENLAIPVPDIRAAVIIAGHVLIFSGIAARRWPASAARIMRVDGENAVRAAGFLRLCLMWTGVSVMTAHIAMSFAGFSGGTLWVEGAGMFGDGKAGSSSLRKDIGLRYFCRIYIKNM